MNNFWRNKNVLITGVTGFVGGNLVKKILDSNANVFGIIRNENPFSYTFLEGLHKKIRLIEGDLMNHKLLLNVKPIPQAAHPE